MKFTCEISKKSSARSLSHVISHIKQPKPQNKDYNRTRSGLRRGDRVAHKSTNVGGMPDDHNGDGDRTGSDNNERSPTTEPAGAAVAQVTDQRLYNKTGERTA